MSSPLPFRQAAVSPGWLSELRACVALAAPLALTNAIEMAMNVTSVAMIGRLGPESLAASTLALALYNLFLLFGIGVTAAVAPLIARAIGAGPDGAPAVRTIVQQGLWGAVIITGPMWVVLWNAAPILTLLGQDPELAAQAALYMHALQWTILPALVYLVLRSCLATLGRPGWAVATGAAAVALNALLNWLLIDGHAGVPALGLFGSGVATLLSNIALVAALAIAATHDRRTRPLRLFTGLLRPQWVGFGAFWRLGLPIGVGLMLETGMFAAAAGLVGRIDAPSLAAHAIALQVAAFTFMVPLGLGQAVTIRIGRALGAGDRRGVARAGWTSLGLSTALMVGSAAILITDPEPIIGLFLDTAAPDNAAVQAVAVTLLALAGLFQIADGAQVVLGGMLRGLHDTRVPMMIAAVGYWGVGLPLGALLAFGFHLQAAGVWIGLTAGLFTVATLLLARWHHLRPRIEADPAAELTAAVKT